MNDKAEIDTISEIAADYVVKLYSGDISEQDQMDIQSWLAEDERHFQEYQDMLNAWETLADYPAKKEQISAQQNFATRFAKPYKFVAIAASVCLLVVTIFLSLPTMKEQPPLFTYQTSVGQQKTINLSDGSVITLNTDTLLHVDFRNGKRHLRLEFGEAFFDVAKDPERPMQIDMMTHKVTVLGTKFNLYRSALEVKVAVVEGLVSLDAVNVIDTVIESKKNLTTAEIDVISNTSDKKMLLTAGEAVNVSIKTEKLVLKTKADVAKLTDWRDGFIHFDSKPLFEVVSELNRYSRRKILLEDKNIIMLPVTGIAKFNEIETILQAIDSALPVEVIHYSDRYVILGEK